MTQAPKGGWKLKLHSHHYLRVWFKDGNVRTLYSLDWRSKYSKHDPEICLARLRKKVGDYGSLANGAIIYSNSTKEPLEEYYEGHRTDMATDQSR